MKLIIRTFIFHILCIIFFSCIYINLKDHFKRQTETKLYMSDYFLLGTTIQSGVGISDLYPITFYGKLTMIIQQLVMIITHIFTLNNFNLFFSLVD